MLRGGCFVENDAGFFFLHLMELIDVTTCEWYVDDVELNYIYFREGQYSGSEFRIALENLSCLSFARIRQYPLNASIHTIDDYNDYIESECESLLLFYDGGYFEFYTKNSNLLQVIFKFGIENRFSQLQYIDDTNVARTWMHF